MQYPKGPSFLKAKKKGFVGTPEIQALLAAVSQISGAFCKLEDVGLWAFGSLQPTADPYPYTFPSLYTLKFKATAKFRV